MTLQPDYGLENGLHRGVEYIQPPAAHSNRDLLAIHRGAQHYGSPASHHDSLYAPATVYVTAAGYQQIAIPPPAHHARPVLPPPMQVFRSANPCTLASRLFNLIMAFVPFTN